MPTSQEILAARKKTKDAHNQDTSFWGGLSGGHKLDTSEGINSWLTEGISGLAVAETLSDDEDARRWAINRKGMEAGVGDLDRILDAYREQGELENFTQEEHDEIQETLRRKQLILRDLAYVEDKVNGDMDAAIDAEGNSFNQRWGLETEDDEAIGVGTLIKAVASNPVHASGLIVGELIKDLPLAVVASLGLASKGLKGAELTTKIYNKLNGIKPKALRGLAKVATPVTAGAIAGGTYEAGYSAMNEGKLKHRDIKTGTEFGAAFGLLAGAGILTKDLIPKKKIPTETPDVPPDVPPNSKIKINEHIESTITPDEMAEVSKFSRNLIEEHQAMIFPDIDPDSFTIKTYEQAVKEGLINSGYKTDKVAWVSHNSDTKHSTIIWNQKALKDTAKRLTKDWDKHTSDLGTLGGFGDITPNMLKYIKDEDALSVFALAHEKAHIFQRQQGYIHKPHAEDVNYNKGKSGSFELEKEANRMAMQEMDRLYSEHKVSSANKSEAHAEAEALLPKDHTKDKESFKEEALVPERQQDNKGISWLENNKGKATLTAGIGAYALADKEDATYAALAAGGIIIGGPKAYRALTSFNVPQVVAKARVQIARANESISIYAKQLDVHAQELGDAISTRYRDEASAQRFLNYIEKPDKYKPTDPIDVALVKQWREWNTFLAKQGSSVGMFKEVNEGVVKNNLVSNYVSHIVKGIKDKHTGKSRALTNTEREELTAKLASSLNIKLTGSVRNSHEIPRKIIGSIEDLKKNYDVLDNPSEILAIYTQAMARTIHNRKLIEEFKELDLGDGKRKIHALLTDKQFQKAVDDKTLTLDEQRLYKSSEHPSLLGYKVHSNIADILGDYFTMSREGGFNDFMEGLLSLNNSLKRVFVFGSLFHAQALLMSGMYSLGVVGAFKGLRKKGRGDLWKSLDLNSSEFHTIAKEALRDGLQILNVKKQGLVNPGKVELDEFLDKAGFAGDMAKKGFGKLDTITWEFMHDRYKLASYLKHKEQLMSKGMSDVDAGKKAADFTNSAFGSLDWNNFASRLYNYAYNNPNSLRGKGAEKIAQLLPANKRRWLNLGLFAPDWTISNLRIIGKTFTDLPEVSDAFLNGVLRGKNWDKQEAKDIISAWKMHADYTTRAGFYTSAMWWMFTEMFSDNDPNMSDLQDFWFGKNSGKLDLGNGRSMVISKQVAEFVHWFQHPQHSLLNKASIVPKTLFEGTLNKQWLSMKKGSPHGPSIIDPATGVSHLGKWVSGKFVPIGIKPMMDDSLDLGTKVSSTVSGLLGFPQYTQSSK